MSENKNGGIVCYTNTTVQNQSLCLTSDANIMKNNEVIVSLWYLNGKLLPYEKFMVYNELCMAKPPEVWQQVTLSEIVEHRLLTDYAGKAARAVTSYGDLYVEYLYINVARNFYYNVIFKKRKLQEQQDKMIEEKILRSYVKKDGVNE